ncbi:MAG: cyanoexosortase B system-associated protein [Coleofasciculus sp. C2-GNP5-27]
MKANLMKSSRLHQVIKRLRFNRAIVLLVLLVIVAIGAVPSYFTGNWSWIEPPRFANFSSIKVVQIEGLEIPGWETLEQRTVTLGGHKWSYQEIKGDLDKPVLRLLRPPNGPIDQPQVEWMDINGVFQWKKDSHQRLKFTVETQSQQAQVNARLFRAWTQQQTFAVVQWYAWATGGHPATRQWFWVDQVAQLKRQRVPWIAVSIQIPMEPLGDLADAKPIAESLSQTVQKTLMTEPLAGED